MAGRPDESRASRLYPSENPESMLDASQPPGPFAANTTAPARSSKYDVSIVPFEAIATFVSPEKNPGPATISEFQLSPTRRASWTVPLAVLRYEIIGAPIPSTAIDVWRPVPAPGSAVSIFQANGAVVGPASAIKGCTPKRIQPEAAVTRITNKRRECKLRRFPKTLGAIDDAKLAGQMKIRSDRSLAASADHSMTYNRACDRGDDPSRWLGRFDCLVSAG